ncbi:unnamed protein product [Polarella glacialis]|uniref:Dynein heavy chain ATP-binding dynein motor region domain-containing protein n=1 Tax=Polarella glacialis TaxID=89957 RepID=A0A813KVL5_POLGL|nr:unnamed protein product [Polarella glacialis]
MKCGLCRQKALGQLPVFRLAAAGGAANFASQLQGESAGSTGAQLLGPRPRYFSGSKRGFSTGFTETHEWVRCEGKHCTVGISRQATAFLGEVFWVELPVVGKTFSEGTVIATLEGMRHPPGTEDRGHAMPLKGKGVDFAEQEEEMVLDPLYEKPGWSVQETPIGGLGKMLTVSREILAPADCVVTAVNGRLGTEKDLVNSASETEGWLVEVELTSKLPDLMDEDAYAPGQAGHQMRLVLAASDPKRGVEAVASEVTALHSKQDRFLQEVSANETRIGRVENLLANLGDQRADWAEKVGKLRGLSQLLPGDALFCALMCAHGGPLNQANRSAISERAVLCMQGGRLDFSQGSLSLAKILGSRAKLTDWHLAGLPQDPQVVENMLIMDSASTLLWPFMVDPHTQGVRFVKEMSRGAFGRDRQKENPMKIVRESDPGLLQVVTATLELGGWLLIEEVGSRLDVALLPLLERRTEETDDGECCVRLGGSLVTWNPSFRLLLATSSPTMDLLPELAVHVTPLNFSVTLKGIEEQMLSLVISYENPDLEKRKAEVIGLRATYFRELEGAENKVLQILNDSGAAIFDDEQMISSILTTRLTWTAAEERAADVKRIEVDLDSVSISFATLAHHVSSLVNVVLSLDRMSNFYQFSLEWVKMILRPALEETRRGQSQEEQLQNAGEHCARHLYRAIAPSLCEQHRIVFGLHLALAQMLSLGRAEECDVGFLLNFGSAALPSGSLTRMKTSVVLEAALATLPPSDVAIFLALIQLPAFTGLTTAFVSAESEWKAWRSESIRPDKQKLPGNWESRITPLQRLCLLAVLRPDGLPRAAAELVARELGCDRGQPPPVAGLDELLGQWPALAPVLFVLHLNNCLISPICKGDSSYLLAAEKAQIQWSSFARLRRDSAFSEGWRSMAAASDGDDAAWGNWGADETASSVPQESSATASTSPEVSVDSTESAQSGDGYYEASSAAASSWAWDWNYNRNGRYVPASRSSASFSVGSAGAEWSTGEESGGRSLSRPNSTTSNGWSSSDPWASTSDWWSNSKPPSSKPWTRPNAGKDHVPEFDGETPMRLYVRKVQIFQYNTTIDEEYQGGKLLERLTGKAATAAEMIDVGELRHQLGVQRLLAHLWEELEPLEYMRVGNTLSGFYEDFYRKRGEEFIQYDTKFRGQMQLLKEIDCELTGTAKAFWYLKKANIGPDLKRLVMSGAGNVFDYPKLRQSITALIPKVKDINEDTKKEKDGPGYFDKKPFKKKFNNKRSHGVNEVEHDEPPPADDEDDEASDDTESEIGQLEHEAEILMTQASKKRAEADKARGFSKIEDPAARSKRIVEMKSRMPCSACKSKGKMVYGHWHEDEACPYRKKKAANQTNMTTREEEGDSDEEDSLHERSFLVQNVTFETHSAQQKLVAESSGLALADSCCARTAAGLEWTLRRLKLLDDLQMPYVTVEEREPYRASVIDRDVPLLMSKNALKGLKADLMLSTDQVKFGLLGTAVKLIETSTGHVGFEIAVPGSHLEWTTPDSDMLRNGPELVYTGGEHASFLTLEDDMRESSNHRVESDVSDDESLAPALADSTDSEAGALFPADESCDSSSDSDHDEVSLDVNNFPKNLRSRLAAGKKYYEMTKPELVEFLKEKTKLDGSTLNSMTKERLRIVAKELIKTPSGEVALLPTGWKRFSKSDMQALFRDTVGVADGISAEGKTLEQLRLHIEMWEADLRVHGIPEGQGEKMTAEACSPLCQDCGIPMMERRNRLTKEPFFGCVRFPACRFTLPVTYAGHRIDLLQAEMKKTPGPKYKPQPRQVPPADDIPSGARSDASMISGSEVPRTRARKTKEKSATSSRRSPSEFTNSWEEAVAGAVPSSSTEGKMINANVSEEELKMLRMEIGFRSSGGYHRSRKRPISGWVGPALVVGFQGEACVWVSYGGRCYLVAVEHCREVIGEENEMARPEVQHLVKLFKNQQEEVEFEDLTVQEGPGDNEDLSSEEDMEVDSKVQIQEGQVPKRVKEIDMREAQSKRRKGYDIMFVGKDMKYMTKAMQKKMIDKEVPYEQIPMEDLDLYKVGHWDYRDRSHYDAASVGKMYSNITGLSLGVGATLGLATFCSQAHGAGLSKELNGLYFRRSLVLLSGIFCVALAAAVFCEPVLLALGQPASVARTSMYWSCVQLVGVPFYWVSGAMRMALNCAKLTHPGLLMNIVSSVAQVLLTILFMHPQLMDLGYLGAAFARSLGGVVSLVFITIYIQRHGLQDLVWKMPPNSENSEPVLQRTSLWNYLRVSMPSAVIVWSEWWAFEVLAVFVGRLPDAEVNLAAHGTMFSIIVVFYMIWTGVSNAVCTLVGSHLGAEEHGRLQPLFRAAFALSSVTSMLVLVMYHAGKGWFAAAFTADKQVQAAMINNAIGLELSIPLYAQLMTFYGVLRGANQMRPAILSTLVGYWMVGLPLAGLLGCEWQWPTPLTGVWLGNVVALLIASSGVCWTVFQHIDWKTVRRLQTPSVRGLVQRESPSGSRVRGSRREHPLL